MAEIRKIVIEIGTTQKNATASNNAHSSSSTGGKKSVLSSKLKPSLYYENKEAEQQLLSLKTMAIQNSIQAVKQSVNLGMRRYFSLTEDYIAENTLSNISVAINKGVGLASNIIAGASAAGPAGAVVGMAAWGVTEFSNYQARMSGYYSSLNATNYNNSYERTRAGLVDNGRGTDN
jgi:hypothetical protein